METWVKRIGFSLQIATFLMVVYMSHKVKPNEIVVIKQEVRLDTVWLDRDVVIYKDTSDSQFDKAIREMECRYMTKLRKGKPIYPPVGDGGRAIGVYQMHEIYWKGCEVAQIMGYSYEDMFDEQKANHVFWAVCGARAYRFRKENGRLPTKTELAMMHNAGYGRYNRAQRYKRKFERTFNTRL